MTDKTQLPAYSHQWYANPPCVKTDDGRVFEFFWNRPYTRLDGSRTMLLIWCGECEKCGELFEVCTPVRARRTASFGRKHCDEHKKRRGVS